MNHIFNFFRNNDIGEPPWEYHFLYNLSKSEYPKYLAKIFNYRTGEKLPLKYDFKTNTWIIAKNKCKTFNQKIQWIKLYGVTDLMRKCTDKVAVRDYVAEIIGSEYLKPVLQVIPSLNCNCHVIARNNSTLGDEAIRKELKQKAVYENLKIKSINQQDCHGSQNDIESGNDGKIDDLHPKFNDVATYFDQINFNKLPNSFVIKCNHGCKWNFFIKNKKNYLSNKHLFEYTKQQLTDWLKREYWCLNGFELQYKNIYSKILIEPLLYDNFNQICSTIVVYCFSGIPKFLIQIDNYNNIFTYNSELKIINNIFKNYEQGRNQKIYISRKQKSDIKFLLENILKLSKKLAHNFNLVRIDWMLFKDKLYFEEMTFTPYSGFSCFYIQKDNLRIGKYLNLERI